MKLIFHIDCDSFFANAEISQNQSLIKKSPLAIISINNVNSMVVACCKESKKMGIKVTMKIKEALKIAPHLNVVKSKIENYKILSEKISIYLQKNFGPKIEKGSIDEWYLDFSNCFTTKQAIIDQAKKIYQNLLMNFKIPITIGISTTKFYSKMATNYAKKIKDFYFILKPKNFLNTFQNHKITEFHGIGKQTIKKLMQINVKTFNDLAKCSMQKLFPIFKDQTHLIQKQIQGEDENFGLRTRTNFSVGRSMTIYKKLSKNNFNDLLNEVAKYLIKKIKIKKILSKTIKLEIIYVVDHKLITKRKQKTFARFFKSELYLKKCFKELYENINKDAIIKKIDFSINNLQAYDAKQMTIKKSYYQKEALIDKILNQFNDDHKIVFKASELIQK